MEKQFVVSSFLFCMINKTWKILLHHHVKLDKWLIVGGHINQGENPIQALKREIREESGIVNVNFISYTSKLIQDFSDAKFILPPEYVFEEVIPKYKDQNEHIHIDLLYLCTTEDRNIVLNQRESKDIRWFELHELKKLNMFPMTREVSTKILKRLNNSEKYCMIK